MIRDTREAEGGPHGPPPADPAGPGDAHLADGEVPASDSAPIAHGDEYRYEEDDSAGEDSPPEDSPPEELSEEDLFGELIEDGGESQEDDASSSVADEDDPEGKDDEPFDLLVAEDSDPFEELDDEPADEFEDGSDGELSPGASRLQGSDPLGLTAVGLDSAEDDGARDPARAAAGLETGETVSEDDADAGGEDAVPAAGDLGDTTEGDAEGDTEVGAADDAEDAAEPVVEEPRLEEPEEIQRAVEAVLFAVSEPLGVRALAEILDVGVHDVRAAVDDLRYEYTSGGRAFRLEEIAGGFQILTLSRYDPWLSRLREKEKQARLSAAALETLSVVAYKQPIAKADLEGIRGVDCSQMLRKLMDRGLIDVVGRDEGLGRALLYGTTPLFLESFGLGTVRDLPEPEDLLGKAARGEPAEDDAV